MESDLHPDATIIDRLGGPTTVTELMGLRGVRGAVQRVSNWKRRGIPPGVRLKFPDLFHPDDVPTELVDAAGDGGATLAEGVEHA